MKRKNKRKKKDASSSSDSQDEDKETRRKTMRQLRHETMIRQRMTEARPKTPDERFAGDEKVNYQNFTMRFEAVTHIEGANPLDVLNELTHWLKGAPLKLANAHIGAKDPKKAMREIWRQLDMYYAAQIQTASERIRPILTKGKIQKDNVDGLLEFMSKMLAIQTQLRGAGIEEDLHRQDLVRDLINKKLPFMSEDFYKAEVKRQKRNPRSRMNFDNLMQAVSDKVRTLKAQGISSKKEETAKVQTLDGNERNDAWKRKAESPPKKEAPKKQNTVKCFLCNASHPLERCNKLLKMPLKKEWRS